MAQQNHILYNPASEIELPRQRRRLPKTILETLYSTGIRRMELVNLTVYDMDSARKTVFISEGKGQKDRLLPLGERALYWIDHYKQRVRPPVDD